MSEIDDIFSSKGKGQAAQPVASTSSLSDKNEKKKKKTKKRKRDEPTSDLTIQPQPIPETVVDTSNSIISSKRPKIESKPKASNSKPSTTEEFSDSRGSRTRKTTEEGWTIYKEDELGIRDEGGDTPLCPFDCECCF
ncbi:hypothetical protein DXG01_000098 [Tephrocybe rancida]|nr:hypothetical protein DXG01_000098 [Tephrocybe rancida]